MDRVNVRDYPEEAGLWFCSGAWSLALCCVTLCPTGWLLVLPFPTFVDRERPDGHLTGSVRISGPTEILPKDEGTPG